MDMGLKGKRALVVGAGKNIGEAIAKCLADEGCKLFLIARDGDKLKKLCGMLGGKQAGHDYLAIDLRIERNPTEAAKEALRRSGGIDVVIHNVGGALGYKDMLGSLGEWEDVWQFNVGIAIEMNRILVPPMRQKKWGRIVHISSIVADLGEPFGPFSGALPYVAAKAYLNAYVKGLGRGLAADNVIVSGVMPGAVHSPGKFWDRMLKDEPKQVQDFIDHFYPVGRFGKPGEIAPFVALLSSEHASFASGALVPVSGGQV